MLSCSDSTAGLHSKLSRPVHACDGSAAPAMRLVWCARHPVALSALLAWLPASLALHVPAPLNVVACSLCRLMSVELTAVCWVLLGGVAALSGKQLEQQGAKVLLNHGRHTYVHKMIPAISASSASNVDVSRAVQTILDASICNALQGTKGCSLQMVCAV